MDDDTIRCILTAEDLEENGLNLEDFFHNSEHAHEFLQTIVEKAKEEVGYEFAGGALAMQVMPLPQNGLLITFSEKTDSFLKGLSEHLKDIFQVGGSSEIADMMEQKTEDPGNERGKFVESLLRNIIESKLEQAAKAGGLTGKPEIKEKQKKTESVKKEEQQKIPDFLLYQFETLDTIEKFSASAESGRFLKSSVYYLPENQQWYLAVWRGRTGEVPFRRFCASVLEFGRLVTDSGYYMEYLREHGECILEKDALNRLREL